MTPLTRKRLRELRLDAERDAELAKRGYHEINERLPPRMQDKSRAELLASIPAHPHRAGAVAGCAKRPRQQRELFMHAA